MDFLIFIAVYLTAYYAAYYLALFAVGSIALHSVSFEKFIKAVLVTVYSLSVVVVACWLVFGASSSLFMSFALSYCITLLRIDYEDSYDVVRRIG